MTQTKKNKRHPLATKLTSQQALFVREYLKDLNATQAAIRAGYAEHSASVTGCKLLKVPKIADAVEKVRGKLREKAEVTAERIVQEYAKIAFLDIADLVDDSGTMKRISEIPEDARRAIAGLEVSEIFDGDGECKHVIGLLKKIKLSDKKGALDSLARHLGMFVDKVEHSGPDGGPITVASISDEERERLLNVSRMVQRSMNGEGSATGH